MIDKQRTLRRLEDLRQNPNEDAVLDLMDEIEGWASPHRVFETLDVEELRGRMVELTKGRELLPNWLSLGAVLDEIDKWEAGR